MMKIKMKSADLAKAVKRVVAFQGRGNLPILKMVHFKAEDGKLTLTTSDLDHEARCDVPCGAEGMLCLDGKRLSTILSAAG